MKKFISLLLLLFSFSSTALYGQFGLQASLLAPSGYYSYLLKPGPGVELYVKPLDPENHYSLGVGLGYYRFTPTQDTFKTFGVGSQFYPGFEVIHNYEEFSCGAMNEYRFLPDSKFCPVVGLDVDFYLIGIGEDYYVETIESSTDLGDDNYFWLLSVIPKIGVQYKISDNFFLAGFVGRSMSFIGTIPNQAFWKTSLSITYTLDQ